MPYGRDLADDTYATVASLAFLCAYFEEEFGRNAGCKAVLRECADRARVNSGLPVALAEALAFWRSRYVEAGSMNSNFRSMSWRGSDDVSNVEAVLLDRTTAPNDQIMALLTIAYRLRNNLFHGLKGIGELNYQRENLAVACTALSATMELL